MFSRQTWEAMGAGLGIWEVFSGIRDSNGLLYGAKLNWFRSSDPI